MRLPIASLAALVTSLGLSASTMTGMTSHHGATARAASASLAALRYGRSVGSPTDGRLVGGTHLDETGYLRVVPADAAGDVRWGMGPLVGMIDRSARAVRRQFPEAVTSVGHLSRVGGGDIDQHRSHESGRDADVGFFVRSASGKELLASHFVAFRGDGTAPTWPGASFDDARNWALVSSMIGDPDARVTHVFVAAPLRARLLSYAEHTGAPASVRARAAELMQQPRGALAHDDHFHVRIGCPAHMTSCIENPMVRLRHPELYAHGRRRGILPPAGAGGRPASETATASEAASASETGAASAPAPAPTLAPARTPAPSPDPTPDAPPASLASPVPSTTWTADRRITITTASVEKPWSRASPASRWSGAPPASCGAAAACCSRACR